MNKRKEVVEGRDFQKQDTDQNLDSSFQQYREVTDSRDRKQGILQIDRHRIGGIEALSCSSVCKDQNNITQALIDEWKVLFYSSSSPIRLSLFKEFIQTENDQQLTEKRREEKRREKKRREKKRKEEKRQL